MKIFITGASGYLGGRLAEYLLKKNKYEILLGSRSNRCLDLLNESGDLWIDWNSKKEITKACSEVDAVIHLAGMNSQDCASNPSSAIEVNAVATSDLTEISIKQGVKRFIYISTAHIYGSPLEGEISEDTCPSNMHPYATSHRAGEDAVLYRNLTGDIEGFVLRLSNTFGAPLCKDVNCWMLLVNDLSIQGVTTGKLELKTTGLQRRDFLTINDFCRAVEHFLNMESNSKNNIYNIGGMWSPTVMEMTQLIAERISYKTGKRPEIKRKEPSGLEASNQLNYNIQKLLNTGFKLEKNIHNEMDSLIEFCLLNFT